MCQFLFQKHAVRFWFLLHKTLPLINQAQTLEAAWVHAKSFQSCLTLGKPMDCSPLGSSVHGDSPGKNIWEGCHALLQGIFPTQGLNSHLLRLLHWQAGSSSLVPPFLPVAEQRRENHSLKVCRSGCHTQVRVSWEDGLLHWGEKVMCFPPFFFYNNF